MGKCPKCDKEELEKMEEMAEQRKKAIIYKSASFPFQKGQYYLHSHVRHRLGLGLMPGINYHVRGNFLVLFISAHNPQFQQNSQHLDRFDPQTNLYHYTGRGSKGDQALTGANDRVHSSNKNKTEIHLFRQQNGESKHKYIGLVKLEDTIPTIQPDEEGKDRKIYEFLLRPVE